MSNNPGSPNNSSDQSDRPLTLPPIGISNQQDAGPTRTINELGVEEWQWPATTMLPANGGRLSQDEIEDEFEQYDREAIPITRSQEQRQQSDEDDDEVGRARQQRSAALARLLHSYYLRIRRTQSENGDEQEDEDESVMRRPRSRLGSLLRGQSARSWWPQSPQNRGTSSGQRVTWQGVNQPPPATLNQVRIIENTFHQRSQAHIPRRNMLLNYQGSIEDDSQAQCMVYPTQVSIEERIEELRTRVPPEWMTEIQALVQELSDSPTFQWSSHQRNFETTVADCASSGPITLLLYLRIAQLTNEQKESKRNGFSDSVDMTGLCMLDLNQSSDGLKYVNRILSFFAQNMKEIQKPKELISTQALLKAKMRIVKLFTDVIPSLKGLKQTLKLALRAREYVSEKEKLTFKGLIDILDLYYSDDFCSGGSFNQQSRFYKKNIMPLIRLFYGSKSHKKALATDAELGRINSHIKIQTTFFNYFEMRTTRKECLEQFYFLHHLQFSIFGYFEGQVLRLDNLTEATNEEDFYQQL